MFSFENQKSAEEQADYFFTVLWREEVAGDDRLPLQFGKLYKPGVHNSDLKRAKKEFWESKGQNR